MIRLRFAFALVVTWPANLLFAANPVLEFARLDLSDGRKLRNVTIKTYDPVTDKVLLVADGKALFIPRTLIPVPFADTMKQAPRSGESVTTIPASSPRPIAAASDQYNLSLPVPAAPSPGRVGSGPISPQIHRRTSAPASARPPRNVANGRSAAQPASSDQAFAQSQQIKLSAHRQVALERARRYYRYEFRVGSDSALLMDVEIEMGTPQAVPGWEGRCRAEGKAYLQVYDSRGGSFQRRTSIFEVVTEEKQGSGDLVAIDFTPKT